MSQTINKTALRWTLTIALFMDMMDSTVVNTSFPQIALSLHESPLQLKVALTSYLLSLGVFTPVSGWVADRFGTRNTFLTAIMVFLLGSVLCACAWNLPWLVVARVIQGAGGAMMSPVGRLITWRVFERSELIKVTSKIATVSLVGPIIGPVIGGALTTYLSWRWIFLVNIPFGLIGIWAAMRFIPQLKSNHSHPFDWLGFLLLSCGMALLLAGCQTIIGHQLHTWPVTMLIAGILSVWIYIFYASLIPHPLISLRIFKQRVFRTCLLAGLFGRFGVQSVPFLLPLLFQMGHGLSAVNSGAMLIPMALGAMLMKQLLAPVMRYLQFRQILICNAILLALYIMSFSLLTRDIPWWMVEILLFGYGLLSSLLFSTFNMLISAEVEESLRSQSNSIAQSIQQVGASFNIAFAALILEFASHSYNLMHSIPLSAFRITFVVLGILSFAALPLYATLKPEDGQSLRGK